MRRFVLDNLKNLPGWRTRERLVVLAVDDYGSVRLDSGAAKRRLASAGLSLQNRFDRLDALETRQDLEAMFEVLSSVSDSCGRHAVFTTYSLSANPDFDALLKRSGGYRYESLTQTFERLSASQPAAYDGAWPLFQEGVSRGLFKPQFHGREHFNVELLERKLRTGDKALLLNLRNKSLAGLNGEASMPGVGFTHAFGLWAKAEIVRHREIIKSGLSLFETVYGFASRTFTPPALKLHPDLRSFVVPLGVDAIDMPLRHLCRLDRNATKREWNTLGTARGRDQVSIVRNVLFEPTSNQLSDSVGLALSQVAAAFRWHKPAIISSHRVNFSGHIDARNRGYGLVALKRLLDGIVDRWPDVQFVSADELVARIIATA